MMCKKQQYIPKSFPNYIWSSLFYALLLSGYVGKESLHSPLLYIYASRSLPTEPESGRTTSTCKMTAMMGMDLVEKALLD